MPALPPISSGPTRPTRGVTNENWRVVRLHEQALTALDATWFDAPDANDVARLRGRFAPRIAALVQRLEAEAAGRPLVIKDPRAGVLTGLWDEQLNGRLIPLLVLRDPREIALSLSRRDGTPPALGLAGWERHMRLLLSGLQGREAVVVQYAELVADPGGASRVVADLAEGLPEPLAAAGGPRRGACGHRPGAVPRRRGR